MDKKILLQDLADGLVRRKGITKKEAEIFIRSVFDIIGEYLQSDKIVKVKGLGTFKLVTVDSRESVDVNTGERIVIKEYTKINFTPDPVLRDAINKPFIQFETVVLYEDTDVAEMERMDLPDLPEETEEENATGSPDENLSSEVLVPEEGEDFVEDSDENGESEDDMSSDVSAAAMGVETEAIDDSEAVADESDSRDMEDEEEPEEEPVAPEEVTPDPSGATVNRNNEEKEQPREEDIAPQEENVEPKEGGVEFSEEDVEPRQADVVHSPHIVENLQVGTQQIDVQKVEHQKVEHQHIVHVSPDNGKRRIYLTPWMIFFMSLLVLILIFISYYLGYTHSYSSVSVSEPSPVRAVVADTMKVQEHKPVAIRDTDSLKVTSDTVSSATPPKPLEKENKPTGTKPKTIQKSPSLPQVEGGAYEIIGTQEEYQVKSGETLRMLALKYYGSKDFTVYLVKYNGIENPDHVAEGLWLKIPQLRLKRR